MQRCLVVVRRLRERVGLVSNSEPKTRDGQLELAEQALQLPGGALQLRSLFRLVLLSLSYSPVPQQPNPCPSNLPPLGQSLPPAAAEWTTHP